MITDNEFSSLIKSQLPDTPQSEWFTRKVINRLPPQHTCRSGGVVWWACVGCLVAIAAWLCVLCIQNACSPTAMTIGDLIMLICCILAAALALWQMAVSKSVFASGLSLRV